MTVRERFDLEPRMRQGIALLMLVYWLGWALGRASGKIEALERVDARKRR